MDLLGDMALFVAVCRAKNFSAAAKATSVPLSSLSRRISLLEAHLGVRLLNRSSRKVGLTEQGHLFVERAGNILEAVTAAENEVRGVAERPGGRLRVSMTAGFGELFLSPLFVEYANRFPDVRFELDLSPRLVDPVAENFDLAIRMGTQPDSSLTTRKVLTLRTGLFASPEYLRRFGEPAEPHELVKHSCLCLTREGAPVDAWSLKSSRRSVSVSVSGRAAANNPLILRAMSVMGLGISILNEELVAEQLEGGSLRRLLPEWNPPLVPVWAVSQSKMMPAKTRLLIECLREHLAQARQRVEKVRRGEFVRSPALGRER